ncbi:hypothetical protein [Undibacterium sp.]|uniref:hypothetical protein n=1 Tax=Undibacterium sp. TaxID=1914977 RepID=UPI0025CC565C|nr:hypothetical protein [Undibacterium sp.]
MNKTYQWHGVNTVLVLLALSTGFICQSLQAQEDKIELTVLQKKIAELDVSFATTSIQTGVQAELALNESEIGQEQLRLWYLQAENDCYDKFFVTSCINDSKLLRRKLFAVLQRISVEAKAFQRKEHIDQIDADLQIKNTPVTQ